ncbi:MAG: gamma-glutamyltransferase [Solirubrobacterales bacterium]|nr:gamma-glutamyltransferase [Solirubrobacterales bacterium]
MISRGVVAAGHPLSAEAGARILREGGNAVDAAVGAVLTSFSAESALTGLGAGGFMAVGGAGASPVLIDFFVAAPGKGGHEVADDLIPVPVHFDATTTQVFNAGAVSCGVPGTAAGLATALEHFGSMPMAELALPAARLARKGAPLNRQQAYVLRILEPIYTATPEGRAIYAPNGRIVGEGEVVRDPELADALERFGVEGPESIYGGETAAAIENYILTRGGTLSRADLADYRAVTREPVGASIHGHTILTNPPPSAGGILIAYSLALLERLGASGTVEVARVMEAANQARQGDFAEQIGVAGFPGRFLCEDRFSEGLSVAERLGSTTHLAAMDANGLCASVTCSNGTGSGMIVPGTGIHLNNMLGEEDLNPLGFHRTTPGTRVSSMMAPTLVMEDREVLAGLGSAGSNRIRSAVLQTTLNLLVEGMNPQAAIEAPRIHLERGLLQAEPGTDESALAQIEALGQKVSRWSERNLFFGGVQMVTRDPSTGRLDGGGDPRRGGAVAYA